MSYTHPIDARPRRDHHRRRPGSRQRASPQRCSTAEPRCCWSTSSTTSSPRPPTNSGALGPVEQLVADLRDPETAQRIVATAVDAFGTVHGLVNNAIATNEPKAFVDITPEDIALGHDVGPRASFLLMQACTR